MNPLLIVQLHFFKEILEAAHREGIDVAPIKGAHMVSFVYPYDEDRGPMADVDFLVRARDFERINRLLKALGYQDTSLPHRKVTWRVFHERQLVKRITDTFGNFVEPHKGFIQPVKHAIDYEAVWNRALPRAFDGVPCWVLSSCDHAAHACLHLETNAFCQPRKSLRDLELLIGQPDFEWTRFIAIVRDWEIEAATWAALLLLKQEEPHLISQEVLDELCPSRLRAAALEWCVGNKDVLDKFQLARLVVWGMCWPTRTVAEYTGYYALLRAADAVAHFASKATGTRPHVQ